MNADDLVIETEDQAAARIRETKTRRALLVASEVAEEMAARVYPADGVTEAGEDVRVARIPMRGRILDDLNDLYGSMVEVVVELAEQADEGLPVAAAAAVWQTRQVLDTESGESHELVSVYGLPWRVSPTSVRDLVRSLSVWLTARLPRFLALEAGTADDLVRKVWTLRFRYGLVTPSARAVSPRTCARCGVRDVRVEFFGGPLEAAEARGERLSLVPRRWETPEQAAQEFYQAVDGITVRCGNCGERVDASVSQVAGWLHGLSAGKVGAGVERERRDALILAESWSVTDAAFVLGVNKSTVSRWVRDGLRARDELGADGQVRVMVDAEAARARRWPE